MHTVDWSRHDDRLLITGGADNCVRLFDLRKASSHGSASMAQVHVFSGHAEAINVEGYVTYGGTNNIGGPMY